MFYKLSTTATYFGKIYWQWEKDWAFVGWWNALCLQGYSLNKVMEIYVTALQNGSPQSNILSHLQYTSAKSNKFLTAAEWNARLFLCLSIIYFCSICVSLQKNGTLKTVQRCKVLEYFVHSLLIVLCILQDTHTHESPNIRCVLLGHLCLQNDCGIKLGQQVFFCSAMKLYTSRVQPCHLCSQEV